MSQQPQYPQQQGQPGPGYGPPGYPQQHTPVAAPSRGPMVKVLNSIGCIGLLVGAILIVVGIVMMWRVLPMGVIDNSGNPGDDAIAYAQPGEDLTADLDADTTYTVFAAYPTSWDGGNFDGTPEVTDSSGETVSTWWADVDAEVTRGQYTAESLWTFETSEAGTYNLEIPEVSNDNGDVTVIVAEGGDMGGFFTSIFGTIGAFLVGGFLGFVGLVLLVIGIVVGLSRRSQRKKYQAYVSGAPA